MTGDCVCCQRGDHLCSGCAQTTMADIEGLTPNSDDGIDCCVRRLQDPRQAAIARVAAAALAVQEAALELQAALVALG